MMIYKEEVVKNGVVRCLVRQSEVCYTVGKGVESESTIVAKTNIFKNWNKTILGGYSMKKHTPLQLTGILLLTILMMAGIFGCSQTPPVSEDDGSKEQNATSGPSDAAGSSEHHLTVMGRDRRFDEVPFADRDQYPTWKAVEKLLSDNGVFCEFELIPTEQYDTVLQTRLGIRVIPMPFDLDSRVSS